MRIGEWMDRYFHVRKCGGCRRILPFESCYSVLCPECRRKWSIAKTETCERCLQSVAECTCQPKPLADAGCLTLRKLFFYTVDRACEPQNEFLYHIKKKPSRRLFGYLAAELAPLLLQELSTLGIDTPFENVVITSIPRTRQSRAVWGFDQAESVARSLGLLLQIPYAPVLYRRFGGKEQKHLSARGRQKNMRRRIRTRCESEVCGRIVVLLDDVVTTGASMSVCATALRQAGAKHIIALSMFQTP